MRASFLVSIVFVSGLAIPVEAQQQPTCDGPQDSCRALVDLTAKYSAAVNTKDFAGLAALYTSDAVIVGEAPIVSGREAIEKSWASSVTWPGGSVAGAPWVWGPIIQRKNITAIGAQLISVKAVIGRFAKRPGTRSRLLRNR